METEEAAEEVYRLQMLIAEEDNKLQKYRSENIRRRHNYTPFIMELLKILAKDHKLLPLIKEAKEKAKKKAEEKREQREVKVQQEQSVTVTKT